MPFSFGYYCQKIRISCIVVSENEHIQTIIIKAVKILRLKNVVFRLLIRYPVAIDLRDNKELIGTACREDRNGLPDENDRVMNYRTDSIRQLDPVLTATKSVYQ